ncbi:tau 95 subunit of transcription factor TFIIIC [Borealophlyctis nickersoniae]|nr:tau 95 subunit of transcription factor TFIIIC [Borealophlyctis nickersoniae]
MSTPEEEKAPSRPLPRWNFHVVEYPGYVKDEQKVLQTLGGMPAIEKAFNEDLKGLELRYRPDDPFSHPINGEIIATTNLLLKVTRRRKKKKKEQTDVADEGAGGDEPWKINTEIVGVVSKTCRFRGGIRAGSMADFQYIPDQADPIVKLRKAMMSLDSQVVDDFSLSEDVGNQDNLRSMPPPSFSRIEWPLDYQFRQNFAVMKVMVQGKNGEPPVLKILSRYRQTRSAQITFDMKAKEVPQAPPDAVVRGAADMDPDAKERLRVLFENRPVWTRLALHNNLPPQDRKRMKALVPVFAYTITSGVFRECWVRYGYDPRADREARFYQIVDARFVKQSTPFSRAKRLRGIQDSSQLLRPRPYGLPDTYEKSIERASEDEQNNDSTHLFDGQTYHGVGVWFQLCDISDPEIRKMIETKKFLRQTFHPRGGWYTPDHFELIHTTIRNKLRKLAKGDEGGGDDLVWEEPEEDPEEEIDEEELLDDVADALRSQGKGKETDSAVKSKVDELMRQLQAAQRGDDAEGGGDEGFLDGEDEDEFTYYEDEGSDDDDA